MLRNNEGRIRSGWKILLVLWTCVGLMVILNMIIAIPVQVELVKNGDITLETQQISQRAKSIIEKYSMIMNLVKNLIFIAVPLFVWKKVMRKSWKFIGLNSVRDRKWDLFKGMLGGGILATIIFLGLLLTNGITVESWQPRLSIITLIWIGVHILTGFAQEISMRGFIMSTLRQTKNNVLIIGIPIILDCIFVFIYRIFKIGSYDIGGIGYLNFIMFSFLCAFMYYKSANIWMGIGFRSIYYIFQSTIFGLSAQGEGRNGILSPIYKSNQSLNGGDYGVESSLLKAIILMISIIVLWIYFKRKEEIDFIGVEPKIEEIEETIIVRSSIGKNTKSKKMSISEIASKNYSNDKEKQ